MLKFSGTFGENKTRSLDQINYTKYGMENTAGQYISTVPTTDIMIFSLKYLLNQNFMASN